MGGGWIVVELRLLQAAFDFAKLFQRTFAVFSAPSSAFAAKFENLYETILPGPCLGNDRLQPRSKNQSKVRTEHRSTISDHQSTKKKPDQKPDQPLLRRVNFQDFCWRGPLKSQEESRRHGCDWDDVNYWQQQNHSLTTPRPVGKMRPFAKEARSQEGAEAAYSPKQNQHVRQMTWMSDNCRATSTHRAGRRRKGIVNCDSMNGSRFRHSQPAKRRGKSTAEAA
jgi:hypothetical protein